jgi:hypothetical protein
LLRITLTRRLALASGSGLAALEQIPFRNSEAYVDALS